MQLSSKKILFTMGILVLTLSFKKSNLITFSNPVIAKISIGVQSLFDHSKITVCPNPAANYFQIESQNNLEGYELSLINMEGETLKEYGLLDHINLKNHSFNIKDIPAGKYLIKIYNQSERGYKMIIINN